MTATSTRTPAQVRAAVEDQGGSLLILNGALRVFAKPSTLEAFRDEIRYHRAALVTLVRSFPCRGCGRDPNCTPLKCGTCSALVANHARTAR
jgi:hypothetical protein